MARMPVPKNSTQEHSETANKEVSPEQELKPFVLYSFRHTFLTKLADIRPRCLDTCQNCGPQLNYDPKPIRSSLR